MENSIRDTTLLKISIIIAFIGIFSLFLIMFFKSEKLVAINEIDDYKDMSVSIKGNIVNISYMKNNTKIVLRQECYTEGIVFNKHLEINGSEINHTEYIFTGKIQDFNNKKSIIIDKISVSKTG